MIINKKLIGHAIENSILIISSLVLYELMKFVYDILRIKYPKKKKMHKLSTLIGNIIMIFILDIILIIILDEFFNINII
jgi:hypothetical protein